jgi:hypothetical protein
MLGGFKDGDLMSGVSQIMGGSKSAEACSDDRDVHTGCLSGGGRRRSWRGKVCLTLAEESGV